MDTAVTTDLDAVVVRVLPEGQAVGRIVLVAMPDEDAGPERLEPRGDSRVDQDVLVIEGDLLHVLRRQVRAVGQTQAHAALRLLRVEEQRGVVVLDDPADRAGTVPDPDLVKIALEHLAREVGVRPVLATDHQLAIEHEIQIPEDVLLEDVQVLHQHQMRPVHHGSEMDPPAGHQVPGALQLGLLTRVILEADVGACNHRQTAAGHGHLDALDTQLVVDQALAADLVPDQDHPVVLVGNRRQTDPGLERPPVKVEPTRILGPRVHLRRQRGRPVETREAGVVEAQGQGRIGPGVELLEISVPIVVAVGVSQTGADALLGDVRQTVAVAVQVRVVVQAFESLASGRVEAGHELAEVGQAICVGISRCTLLVGRVPGRVGIEAVVDLPVVRQLVAVGVGKGRIRHRRDRQLRDVGRVGTRIHRVGARHQLLRVQDPVVVQVDLEWPEDHGAVRGTRGGVLLQAEQYKVLDTCAAVSVGPVAHQLAEVGPQCRRRHVGTIVRPAEGGLPRPRVLARNVQHLQLVGRRQDAVVVAVLLLVGQPADRGATHDAAVGLNRSVEVEVGDQPALGAVRRSVLDDAPLAVGQHAVPDRDFVDHGFPVRQHRSGRERRIRGGQTVDQHAAGLVLPALRSQRHILQVALHVQPAVVAVVGEHDAVPGIESHGGGAAGAHRLAVRGTANHATAVDPDTVVDVDAGDAAVGRVTRHHEVVEVFLRPAHLRIDGHRNAVGMTTDDQDVGPGGKRGNLEAGDHGPAMQLVLVVRGTLVEVLDGMVLGIAALLRGDGQSPEPTHIVFLAQLVDEAVAIIVDLVAARDGTGVAGLVVLVDSAVGVVVDAVTAAVLGQGHIRGREQQRPPPPEVDLLVRARHLPETGLVEIALEVGPHRQLARLRAKVLGHIGKD